MTQKVFIFGNPDLQFDSLPIKILPELKKKLPKIDFEIKDPNEEWDIPEEFIAIDAVLGLKKPMIFEGLENFSGSPCVSLHDFDALANLKYLKKLGKIKKIKIIGLPALNLLAPSLSRRSNGPTITEQEAVNFVIKTISEISEIK